MVQIDFAEKIEIDELQIESTDVMTGDRNSFLHYQLKMSMVKAFFIMKMQEIYILVLQIFQEVH